jgi:hypothetical protein
MAKFTCTAKNLVYAMNPKSDQVIINDLSLNADQASELVVQIKKDPEATLTVSIE